MIGDDIITLTLQHACKTGDTETVKALLKADKKELSTSDNLREALEWAALRGHTEAAKLILDTGNCDEPTKQSALREARRQERTETAKMIEDFIERTSSVVRVPQSPSRPGPS